MEAAGVDLADLSGKLNEFTDEVIATEPLLLRIAALVRYASRDLTRAKQHLDRYVKFKPNDIGKRRQLG